MKLLFFDGGLCPGGGESYSNHASDSEEEIWISHYPGPFKMERGKGFHSGMKSDASHRWQGDKYPEVQDPFVLAGM